MSAPTTGKRGGFRPSPSGYRLVTCGNCGAQRLIEADDDTPECAQCHDGEQVTSERYHWPVPPAVFAFYFGSKHRGFTPPPSEA